MVSGSTDKTLCFYDLQRGTVETRAHEGPVRCMLLNQSTLLTGKRCTAPCNNNFCICLFFIFLYQGLKFDDCQIHIGGDYSIINLYDANQRSLVGRFPGHSGPVNCLASDWYLLYFINHFFVLSQSNIRISIFNNCSFVFLYHKVKQYIY